jgi:hypothetical protein
MLSLPLGEFELAGHAVHDEFSGVSLYLPAAQSTHVSVEKRICGKLFHNDSALSQQFQGAVICHGLSALSTTYAT